MKAQSVAGVSGKLDIVQHSDAVGLSFEDLFTRDGDSWVNKRADKTSIVRQDRNKVLLRALSYHLHRILDGHAGTFLPGQITSNGTVNPFVALFLAADYSTYDADKKPDWNESNGLYDGNIPPNPGVAGEGRRAVLISDTTGPGIKRISIAYPTTNPYREIEYTFFAQANVPVYAAGSVTFVAGASHADGETFAIEDGVNPALTFELDSNVSVTPWDGDPSSNIPVAFGAGDTADQVRNKAVVQVNRIITWMSLNRYTARVGSGLLLTASAGATGVMQLSHDVGGEIGNTAIVVSSAPAFSGSKTDFTGGSDANNLEKTEDGVDNLPIKSLGLAAGVLCGDGEVNSQVATRSVVGLSALAGGLWDRDYHHEGTGLHSYSGADTVGVNGDGYHASSEQEDTVRSIASAALDIVATATNRITMENGNFTGADVGSGFKFTSGTNTGIKTIVKVVDKWTVVVAEAVTSEGTGFTADIVHPATGDKAFDGDVDSEGVTGEVDLGEKWRSATSAGPHTLARVWAASKSVHGVRIIGPAGVTKEFYLDKFKIQKLATQAQGNGSGPVLEADLEPANDNHWIDVGSEVDFTAVSQVDNIYNAAEKGYEFLFNAATTTRGIRIASALAWTTTNDIQIAEFMQFGQVAAITFTEDSDDEIKIATDQAPTGPGVPNGTPGTYKTFAMGDLITSGDVTQDDVQAIADTLNKQLRGYGLEAVRSDLGQLWIRSTVAGDKVQMDVDSVAGGSTALTKLGLGTALIQKVGRTEIVFKFIEDALTIIYRYNMSGDLPVSA